METINKLFDIEGKVAVITGGEGILGSVLTRIFAHCGVKTVILGINRKAGETLVEELKGKGSEVLFVYANVLNKEELIRARSAVVEKWGQIDILINAAGGNLKGATLETNQTVFDLDWDDIKKVTDLNLLGTVFPTFIFAEEMLKKGKGAIVNFSSMASSQVITRVPGYSMAKSGIENFTRWMATEAALKFGEGIRVNAIAPGFLITNQNRSLLTNTDGTLTERGEKVIAQTPFKRFGEPEELTGTIIYLCSNAARFVTGTVIPVDGGFSIFSGV